MVSREHGTDDFEITEDAERELDQWTRHATSELKLRARLYAEGRGSHVIERRDINLASQSLLRGERFSTKAITSPRARIFPLLAMSLLLATAVAIVVSVRSLEEADAVTSVLGGLLGAMGLALAVNAYREQRLAVAETEAFLSTSQVSESADIAEVLAVWRDIETMLREDGPFDEVEARRFGVTRLVTAYADRYELEPDFVDEVRELLRVRNRLVHGGEQPLSHADVRVNLKAAQQILSVLRGVRSRNQGTDGSR